MVPEMLRLLTDSSARPQGHERHISSFQAFAVSLASRAGVKDPVFHRSQLPEIADDVPCWE